MIKEYSISNFKIHKEGYRFNLKGLSIITGTNNSGKSSLTQSLRLLARINSESRDFPRLPFEIISELKDYKSTLNKDVSRKESIAYKFSLELENFEFCNIELEFNSILNYNINLSDMLEQAVLKRIDIYFESDGKRKNYEFYINTDEKNLITYDLNEIHNKDGLVRYLIQNEIVIKGLNISFFPVQLTEEIKKLMFVCNKLSNIDVMSIRYVPAFRKTGRIAEVLEVYKDRIIFDDKTKMIDAFNDWTQRILNSEFKSKVENNINKIVAIDNGIEFDLCQVGFGNEQILPIIIMILTARKGDLVIIENPEVHLHPKWKTNLVELFYFAVNNGVNVLIETQSLEIVNRIRLLIKKDNSLKDKTSLYFFKKHGFDCIIQNIEIEETGNLDSWPDDFIDKVTIEDNFELI